MIPAKEKAKEMVDAFYQTTPNEAWYNPPLGSVSMKYKAWEQAKECAIIAVKELLKISIWTNDALYDYFMEVRQEIEKL